MLRELNHATDHILLIVRRGNDKWLYLVIMINRTLVQPGFTTLDCIVLLFSHRKQ